MSRKRETQNTYEANDAVKLIATGFPVQLVPKRIRRVWARWARQAKRANKRDEKPGALP